ncbi:MAG: hypothetical protein M3139_09890 [Bacteroidota bacterium]|nr:hypothetical protein [Bacteroidota bacterium]
MENVLEKEWFSYFELLNEAEKKSVITLLKTFLQQRNGDAGRITIEQYNKDIDESLSEISEGNYINQDEMEKKSAKW